MESDREGLGGIPDLGTAGGARRGSTRASAGRARAGALALLILNVGKVVSTERLIDDLWGETVPATVQTALHGLVSDLRKRLEPTRTKGGLAALRTAPPGYRLAVEPRCVDANRFRRLLEEARAGEAAERAATLREALGLWRGPALADFTYEPFAQREITTLEELRLEAIEQRVDADMAVGPGASSSPSWRRSSLSIRSGNACAASSCWRCIGRDGRQTRLRSTGMPGGRWSRSWGSSRQRPFGSSSRRSSARIRRLTWSRPVRSRWRRRSSRSRLRSVGYRESVGR